MKEWRVIAVLLAVIVLLSVILGIKIINNTPEKQMQKIINNYNKTEEQNTINQIISNEKNIETQQKIENVFESLIKETKNKAIRDSMGMIIVAGLIGGLFIVVNCKIYYKLRISELPIKIYIGLSILSFFSIFLLNNTLSSILSIASIINNIILMVMEYKVIGINPYLLLLGLIPFVGAIFILIVSIIATCKLADYFGKGTGFKLGLIFLPIIFYPILAFTAEE